MEKRKESIIAEFKNAIQKQDFYSYVQSAHTDGRLAVILPGVDKLFEVKEIIENGRECCASEQVLNVLKKGDDLSSRCKYALLLYSVSKAYTSEKLQPLHPLNYGLLSTSIISTVSEDLGFPDNYNEFAQVFARYHTMMHGADNIKDGEAADLVQTCIKLDAENDFFDCAHVYMECKAERSVNHDSVLKCAEDSEERLKEIFYRVKSGDDTSRLALDAYRRNLGLK